MRFNKKILLFLLTTLFFISRTKASPPVDVFFFHQNGCPHCEEMKIFLAGLVRNDKAIKISAYEVSSDLNNQALFIEMAKAYGASPDGLPMLFIGDKAINGNYPTEVENEIAKCLSLGCASPMEKLKNSTPDKPDDALAEDLMKLRWIVLILAIMFIAVLIYFSREKRNAAQNKGD